VGFWTTGHLFDPADPYSWEGFLPREKWPSRHALERSDHFWNLGHLLKGTPRPLGLSAEGRMQTSPDKKRILKAIVTKAAIAEVPVSPDTTVEIMEFARKVREFRLSKGGVHADDISSMKSLVPEDLEGKAASDRDGQEDVQEKQRLELVQLLQLRYGVSAATAERWIATFLARQQRNQETSHVR